MQSTVRFPALGTSAVVAVSDPGRLDLARSAVQTTLDAFDLACSRFRPDSEVSALNAAAGQPMRVSPLLLEAIEVALRAARLSDGDVDPTIGEALVALGYDRDFASVGDRSDVQIAAVPGWQVVELDRDTRTVRVPPSVTLDLGATAKALAADHAAAAANQSARCSVLVALGGDIALAGAPPEAGWRVRVTDDHAAGIGAPGQWIALRTGGLATSSITVRRWRAGGLAANHLVDPRTGSPVSGPWRTVSVTAASCVDANTASTAAIVRGARAVQWLDRLGLPSRLVSVDGVACHVAGWPLEGEELAVAEREVVA